MSTHREVMVKVNAPVDEGIAELVSALSEIDGLETLESCQGGPGSAFVVFRLSDWRACGAFLFDALLPAMPPDLRGAVSLRLEGYDTQVARGWITLDPTAIESVTKCVRQLAAPPIG